MIDFGTGVEAYVAPHQRKDDPEHYYVYLVPRCSQLFTGNPNERFIEAVTDEQFEIGTVIPAKFDFFHYTHIQTTIRIDGGGIDSIGHVEKIRNRPLSMVSYTALGRVGGRWERNGFAFGETIAVKHRQLSIEQEDLEASKRGKIVVTVQLGKMKALPGKFQTGSAKGLPMETTKRVAVDLGKSHTVKLVPLVEKDETGLDDSAWDWAPARGKNGREIRFTFFYASRTVLELKKIIPIAPTMEIQLKPKSTKPCADNTTDCQDQDDDEVMVLPLSNVPAKRIKIKPADADATIIAPEHASKKIKAEDAGGRASAKPTSVTPTSTVGSAGPAAHKAKARERAKLELQLEEIVLQREENRLKRRMMELEDGE
ncbi:hypothetical protein LTR36_000391 [Oleoguttula mirabilis]|uniref:DUF7918 domain-containing protein n=1 Tax=Oleoguttula mirabilis TaxID=1507867 RepID=A0AAV9JYZ3_9PEZI|nr:hypothetical protein LTR36_000391 [Oleoguttula mirabilis]